MKCGLGARNYRRPLPSIRNTPPDRSPCRTGSSSLHPLETAPGAGGLTHLPFLRGTPQALGAAPMTCANAACSGRFLETGLPVSGRRATCRPARRDRCAHLYSFRPSRRRSACMPPPWRDTLHRDGARQRHFERGLLLPRKAARSMLRPFRNTTAPISKVSASPRTSSRCAAA